MRGRDHEQRIEPRASLGDDAPVADDQHRRAASDRARRFGSETRERVPRVLVPVAVGLEHERWPEPRDHVLEKPRASLARERAEVVGHETGLRRVPAEEKRCRELEPLGRLGGSAPQAPGMRSRTKQHPRREVLDLAFAIDRRVRHDGDRLVQMVGEIRARRERAEGTVVSERSDRLVRGLGHEGGLLEVVGFEPERGELALASYRDVVDLIRRYTDLPAAVCDRRLRRAAAAQVMAHAGDRLAPPHGGEPAADRRLIQQAPAAITSQRDVLARTERVRIGDVAFERHEAALAREYVLVLGLDMPERS